MVKPKRKHTRFKPDPGTVAQVCLLPLKKEFVAEFQALVLSESFSGCSLVLALAPTVKEGEVLRVKVGDLSPMEAEVRWQELLDNEVQKIGLKYLR